MKLSRTLHRMLVALALLSTIATASAVTYAWWLLIEYEPETTQVESIGVSELESSWVLAEALTKAAVPPEELDDFQKNYEPDGYKFSMEGDFNADGKRDRAVVGIYKDKSGKGGRFLLIVTEATRGKWVKSFLSPAPGRSGFSILRMEGNELVWYLCMGCDISSTLKWNGRSYELL
jgi:hypothetical protein